MIISDADRIYLGEQAVDRLYLGEELIWPAEQPVPEVTISGVHDIYGTQYAGGTTLNIWEHNCSIPIWIEHTGELVNPMVWLTGSSPSNFDVEYKGDDLIVVTEASFYNTNNPYDAVINISADNVEGVLQVNIHKVTETSGQFLWFNDHACANSVEMIPADGIDATRQFFIAEAEIGVWGAVEAYVPNAIINKRAFGNVQSYTQPKFTVEQEETRYGNFNVVDSCGDMRYNDDDAMNIYDARSEFMNAFISYLIGPNTTGRTRYFVVHPQFNRATNDPYLFLIQPSK